MALCDLGPGCTMIPIHPMCTLVHSEASATRFFPGARVQWALPTGVPLSRVYLSPGACAVPEAHGSLALGSLP